MVHNVEIKPLSVRLIKKHGTFLSHRQLPLQVAFATTLHSVQGMMLSNAALYLRNKMFSAGMAYVGLSGIRKFDNQVVLALAPQLIGLKVLDHDLKEWTDT